MGGGGFKRPLDVLQGNKETVTDNRYGASICRKMTGQGYGNGFESREGESTNIEEIRKAGAVLLLMLSEWIRKRWELEETRR